MDGDGSFTIGVGETSRSDYFAYVLIDPDAPGVASATWNGVEAESHAHEQLGNLHRQGGCWVNERARCALGVLEHAGIRSFGEAHRSVERVFYPVCWHHKED